MSQIDHISHVTVEHPLNGWPLTIRRERVHASYPHSNSTNMPDAGWLVDAFTPLGISPANMLLYTEALSDDPKQQRSGFFVLEIVTANKETNQILACPQRPDTSFVLKAPRPFGKETQNFHRFLTVQDHSAFIVRCYDREQWTGQIADLVTTPIDELRARFSQGLKWKGKQTMAMETVAAFVRATGNAPYSQDRSPISHGPLHNQTYWDRLYAALQNGILGKELPRTFITLTDHIVRERPDIWEKAAPPAP